MRSFRSVPNLAITTEVHLTLSGDVTADATANGSGTSKPSTRSHEDRRSRRLDAFHRNRGRILSTSFSMYIDTITEADRNATPSSDNNLHGEQMKSKNESIQRDVATDVSTLGEFSSECINDVDSLEQGQSVAKTDIENDEVADPHIDIENDEVADPHIDIENDEVADPHIDDKSLDTSSASPNQFISSYVYNTTIDKEYNGNIDDVMMKGANFDNLSQISYGIYTDDGTSQMKGDLASYQGDLTSYQDQASFDNSLVYQMDLMTEHNDHYDLFSAPNIDDMTYEDSTMYSSFSLSSSIYDATIVNSSLVKSRMIKEHVSTGSIPHLDEKGHLSSRELKMDSVRTIQGEELQRFLSHKRMQSKLGKINVAMCDRRERDNNADEYDEDGTNGIYQRDFHEPIRHRDKDWMVDSGRKIRNQEKSNSSFLRSLTERDEEKKEFSIKLGRYKKTDSSPLIWASIEGSQQSMARRQRILRTSMAISDTRCIISIYGTGIQGRLMSGQPSLVEIECYSVWNSEMYKIQLNDKEMKQAMILAGQEKLTKPGNKYKALKFLLRLLYFQYTITAKEPILTEKEIQAQEKARLEEERIEKQLEEEIVPITYYFDRSRRAEELFLNTWGKGFFDTLREEREKERFEMEKLREQELNQFTIEKSDIRRAATSPPDLFNDLRPFTSFDDSLRPCTEGADAEIRDNATAVRPPSAYDANKKDLCRASTAATFDAIMSNDRASSAAIVDTQESLSKNDEPTNGHRPLTSFTPTSDPIEETPQTSARSSQLSGRSSARRSARGKRGGTAAMIVRVVDHVDDLGLPKCYPQGVSELIRALEDRVKIPGRSEAIFEEQKALANRRNSEAIHEEEEGEEIGEEGWDVSKNVNGIEYNNVNMNENVEKVVGSNLVAVPSSVEENKKGMDSNMSSDGNNNYKDNSYHVDVLVQYDDVASMDISSVSDPSSMSLSVDTGQGIPSIKHENGEKMAESGDTVVEGCKNMDKVNEDDEQGGPRQEGDGIYPSSADSIHSAKSGSTTTPSIRSHSSSVGRNKLSTAIQKRFPLPYLPTLSQTLKIGSVVRNESDAADKRIRITKERLAREAEIERRAKEAWLAIPKRRRGNLVNKCYRGPGSVFMMMAAYRYPKKSSNVSINAILCDTMNHSKIKCGMIMSIQSMAVDQNFTGEAGVLPFDWDNITVAALMEKCLEKCKVTGDVISNAIDPKVRLQRISYGSGSENSVSTSDAEFKPLRSCKRWDKYEYIGAEGKFGNHFMGKSRAIRNYRQTIDIRYTSLQRDEDIEYSKSPSALFFGEEGIDTKKDWPKEARLSYSALSVNSRRSVQRMTANFIQHTPARYMDGHKKILEKVTKISGVTVIGSLHLTTPMTEGDIPEYEGDPPLPLIKPDDADEDEEGETEEVVKEMIRAQKEKKAEFVEKMAVGMKLELRLYLPMRADFSFCNQEIPAQSTYTIHYSQHDLAMAIPDLELQITLLGSLYKKFYEEATEEETTEAESAWEKAFKMFLGRFTWAYDTTPDPPPLTPFQPGDKVEIFQGINDDGSERWILAHIICDSAMRLLRFDSPVASKALDETENKAAEIREENAFESNKEEKQLESESHDIEENKAIPDKEEVIENEDENEETRRLREETKRVNQEKYDVHFDDGSNHIDVTRDKIRLWQPPRIQTFEEKLKTVNQQMNTYIRNSVKSCRIALSRSNVIYRKSAFRFENDLLRPDPTGKTEADEGYVETKRIPVMHVYAWMSGVQMGMVFYDMELEQIHTIQKSPADQKGMIEMLLTMPKHEMIQTLTMIIEAELEYKESYDMQLKKFVGTVDFLSVDEDDAAAADDKNQGDENKKGEEDVDGDEGYEVEPEQPKAPPEPFKADGLFDDLEIDFSDDDDEPKKSYAQDDDGEAPFTSPGHTSGNATGGGDDEERNVNKNEQDENIDVEENHVEEELKSAETGGE